MEDYFIGMDIGTGSTKAIAMDLSGKVLYSCQSHYGSLQTQPEFNEQNPREILQTFTDIIGQTVLNMDASPAIISLSSAMHSIMAVDATGEPLSNLITWQDKRSAALADQLRNSEEGHLIYSETGTPLHAMTPLTKIRWIKDHQPELFKKASRFISIKEYIWFQLFGEFKVDHSIASATGMFDIKNLEWYQPALSFAGITPDKLSLPVETHYIKNDIAPYIAARAGLPATTPFCIGASDGCLANLGTHSIKKGIAAVTIGTSGAVRILTDKPLTDPLSMPFSYILEKDHFICGGPVNNGGNILQWLLGSFLLQPSFNEKDYEELFKKAGNISAGSNQLIFLPYLNGERAPLWDEESCGLFFGLRPYHTQSHFLRAALEGVCFALKQVLIKLEELNGPIEQLNASGGFIRSAGWMQLLADITGKNISLHQTEDASAIGAAILALKATGRIRSYSEMEMESKRLIHPQTEFREVYEKNFSIFKMIYPALRECMHMLH
jgi:gluconokinase